MRKGAARKTGYYGPFVVHRRRHAWLPKEILPGDLTLEQALALLDPGCRQAPGGGQVKGCSGHSSQVELTPNEYAAMGHRRYREIYRVAVVTRALEEQHRRLSMIRYNEATIRGAIRMAGACV